MGVEQQLEALRQEITALRKIANRANDRGEIENLFSRYMYYHNAFQDESIIPDCWNGINDRMCN